MKITVTVDGKKYKLDKKKVKELKGWLLTNGEPVVEMTEDLVIDIQATEGADIKYSEEENDEG